MDDDPHIRKRLDEAANDGLDAFRAWCLARSQRDVVPVTGKYFVDEVWLLVAERAVEGFDSPALGIQLFSKVGG